VPTVTDIHTNEDAAMAAQYVDVLQIPLFSTSDRFSCSCCNTGEVVNLKVNL
jgi:2-dehydro-3-deoxyphosphooctonate aldolase (KDO 8-P synthase)